MDQLWGVLGRAYLEPVFRADVVLRVRADAADPDKPEAAVKELGALHGFLATEGFRVSLHELEEINRIFLICRLQQGNPKPDKDPLAGMEKFSAAATQALAGPGMNALPPRASELWSLIGLCAIDGVVRQRYAVAGDLAAEMAKAPAFRLDTDEKALAARLFADPDALAGLSIFVENCWIPPKNNEQTLLELAAFITSLAANGGVLPAAQCGGAHTLNLPSAMKKDPYLHFGAPFVESLHAAFAAELAVV